MRQAAAAVSVGTYWAWELLLRCGVLGALGAVAPTEGGEGRRHIVAAARLQLVFAVSRLIQDSTGLEVGKNGNALQ